VMQFAGSYDLIRTIFKWLALALFAYVAAALLAKPDWGQVLRGTFMPRIEFSAAFLAMIVACIGTSLSAYVYTWQSNQEVEDQIAEGRTRWWQRRGVRGRELARSRRDVLIGMIFANMILYAIILATAATLHQTGQTSIDSAAQAAQALQPLAGESAKLLFALGVIGVGFLAIPVMTTGAAYDLVQGVGKRGSLHDRIGDAPLFYGTIVIVTVVAIGLNLLGVNPMRALVLSGIVQGFSVPPLLLLMMLMTNDRSMMGEHVNSPVINLMGWLTTAATFAATLCLVASWIIGTER
jgi:Mn2+/Fe2+ NRAMP family transporter